MTDRIGIIGFPTRHSISPMFQNAALGFCKLDAQYEYWEVEPSKLAEMFRFLREDDDVIGANITVPYKEATPPFMDQLDPSATRVGAVNTVVARNGKLIGYNTDTAGFLSSLKGHDVLGKEGLSVLLLGAGGAARAIVPSLVEMGTTHMVVANRTLETAVALASFANGYGIDSLSVELSEHLLATQSIQRRWDLIINTTPIGTKYTEFELASPISPDIISQDALVYDLVYNPPVTPLLRSAVANGAKVKSGLHMLVYQGAESFTLWTNTEAPVDVMMTAAERALNRSITPES